MCKSKAQGGQRCVGHATQRLSKAQNNATQTETAFAAGEATEEQLTAARAANWKALVEYCSTSVGAEALRGQWGNINNPADPNARTLQAAIDDGALLAQANRRVENEYRASQGKPALQTPLPMTISQSTEIALRTQAQVAEQTQRAQDPFGLRNPTTPQPSLPTSRPSLPTRPQNTSSSDTVVAERPISDAQQRRNEQQELARQAREEKQREQQLFKKNRTEARRLERDAAAEAKSTKVWFDNYGTKQFSANTTAWSGPNRWKTGTRSSRSMNKQADMLGKQQYGQAFVDARTRFAGEFSAADVYEACRTLEQEGLSKVTGRTRPTSLYQNYETVTDREIMEARQISFTKIFGAEKANGLAKQYAAANLSGVLWRARNNRPKGSLRSEQIRRIRLSAIKIFNKNKRQFFS